MDYVTMNEQFNKDLEGFEREVKMYIKKRKIAYLTLDITIFFFIGISIGLYLSNSYPISTLTLTISAIVISLFIGAGSYILGWDSQRRGYFWMEYIDMRFNYVMQFIKIVDDKVSSFDKILKDIITLKKP